MIRWLRQYWAISRNAFVVCLSDPLYLVLTLTWLALMALFACLPTYNFGEELRLVRDQSLALLFIGGCVVSVVGAATAIVRDLRQGTVAMLMSRPVSGMSFVFGKWTGIAGALGLYFLTLSTACLWATRLTLHGQHLDHVALAVYVAVVVITLGAMALKHYFFGGWYVWQASLAVSAAFILGFLVINVIGPEGGLQPFGRNVDWATAPACGLLFMAAIVFSALVMPFAIRVQMVTLMLIGCILFFVGLLSYSYLAEAPLLARFAALLPNWQIYWLADLLARGSSLPPGYLVACLVHTVAYAGAALIVATLLFNRREFAAHDAV